MLNRHKTGTEYKNCVSSCLKIEKFMRQETLFELELRLKKAYSTMKTQFYLHNYVNKKNEQQIFFKITINKEKERIPTGYYTTANDWNLKKERTKSNSDLNLVLDNMFAKATEIQTFFRLNHKEVSLSSFLREFFSKVPSYDFLAFMESTMNDKITNANTLKKHKSILNKLRDWRKKIPFTDIDLVFIDKYRKYLFDLGNNKTTRNSNIKIIKYYLIDAQKKGVRFNINLDDIIVGSTSGNRTSLSPEDTRRLIEIYKLRILSKEQQLSLGYFLIACCVSLRISDIKALKRSDFMDHKVSVLSQKTQKYISIPLNNRAKEIIALNPDLFVKFKAEQKINLDLKDIAKVYKVKKKMTMHVGRHTFATNYLKSGGTIQDLQIILDHSSIETTMIYVHLDREEALQTIHLLDDFI
ncbi:integrase [Elizabethkingia anophelis]|nr:integrase [Elizabethkingia anophelis]